LHLSKANLNKILTCHFTGHKKNWDSASTHCPGYHDFGGFGQERQKKLEAD